MTKQPLSLEDQLSALRQSFAADLPQRLAAIASGWQALLDDGWNLQTLGEVYRLVHNLTGAGETFGYPAVSQSARAFEALLKTVAAPGDRPSTEMLRSLQAAYAGLQATVQAALTGERGG